MGDDTVADNALDMALEGLGMGTGHPSPRQDFQVSQAES